MSRFKTRAEVTLPRGTVQITDDSVIIYNPLDSPETIIASAAELAAGMAAAILPHDAEDDAGLPGPVESGAGTRQASSSNLVPVLAHPKTVKFFAAIPAGTDPDVFAAHVISIAESCRDASTSPVDLPADDQICTRCGGTFRTDPLHPGFPEAHHCDSVDSAPEPWPDATIARMLNDMPEVRWDRYVEIDHPPGVIQVYGWVDREDGRSDFVLYHFPQAGHEVAWWTTSSVQISSEYGDSDHDDCERVEDRFTDVTNFVQLAASQGKAPADAN